MGDRRAVVAGAVLLLAAAAAFAGDEEKEKQGPLTRIVRVLRPDGEPVRGATVEAFGLPGGPVARTVDADGVASFEKVPRTGVVFVARAAGHAVGWHQPGAWWWYVPEEDGDPDGDGVTRMEIRLENGIELGGRVVSATDGRPVAGATVEGWHRVHATDIQHLAAAPAWTAVTDAEGRFRTDRHTPDLGDDPNSPDLAVEVIASGRGWIRESAEVLPGRRGAEKPVAFRLLPAGKVHGLVLGADGKPAAGALVHAFPPDFWAFAPGQRDPRDTEDTHPRELHVRADSAGRYEMPEAHPGVKYFLFAEGLGRRPRRIGDFVLGSEEVVVARSPVAAGIGFPSAGEEAARDLRLRRTGSLRLTFAADAGAGAKDLDAELLPPPGVRPWVDDHEEEGAWEFPELDPGNWTLEIHAKDGWLDQRTVVEIAEGEAKAIEVRLSRGAGVEGVVVDDDGKPVGSVGLYAYAVDPADPEEHLPGYEEAWADARGRFRVEGLPAGPVDLSVGGHERGLRQDGQFRVTAPATGVRVPVTRSASLRIRLIVPDGALLPELPVFLTRLDGSRRGSQEAWTMGRAGDLFLLEDVFPGLVDACVDLAGYAPLVRRIAIPPGGSAEPEEFRLEAGFPLHGRVVDGDGKPLPGARIVPWGNEARLALSDGSGRFEVPHLRKGRTDLSIRAEGMAEAILVVAAAPDAVALEVVLRPGGLVRGKVVSRTGEEVEGRSFDFHPAGATDALGSCWRASAGADRTFALRLPAGRYVCVESRGDLARGVAVEVPEGGEVVLDLTVR